MNKITERTRRRLEIEMGRVEQMTDETKLTVHSRMFDAAFDELDDRDKKVMREVLKFLMSLDNIGEKSAKSLLLKMVLYKEIHVEETMRADAIEAKKRLLRKRMSEIIAKKKAAS